jgi:hypothetical protein
MMRPILCPERSSDIQAVFSALMAVAVQFLTISSSVAEEVSPGEGVTNGFAFIDTGFENASPLWYEHLADKTVLLHLLYDHERASPNRAAGHIHFQLHAAPGTRLTLELTNLNNVWNAKPGSVARELKTLVISQNGSEWKPLETQSLPGAPRARNAWPKPVRSPGRALSPL